MLNVSGATRVPLASSPTDLRGSFNRLYSLVVEQLKEDPLSGHLFVFTNRRREQTTFNIPIGHRGYRISVASTARLAVVGSPAKRTERNRGH